MQSEITYKLDEQDLRKVLEEKLKDLVVGSFLNRFTDRLVSAETVADIHGVSRSTVIRYAQAKLLPCEKEGALYKFSLAVVLQVNFRELKRMRH